MLRRHLLWAILLAGCTGPSPRDIPAGVPSPTSFLGAIKPADLGRETEAVQLVSVSRDDKAISVEVRLSVKRDRLLLVAQDMLGQRLMTVRWDDAGVAVERSPNLPDSVSPQAILADLVAISWPATAVQHALDSSGARLLEQAGQRVVILGDRETLHATIGWPEGRWTGSMSYRNVRAGYTVSVQSVEQP
jgi:Protein of unknown function (DUF3261)